MCMKGRFFVHLTLMSTFLLLMNCSLKYVNELFAIEQTRKRRKEEVRKKNNTLAHI